MCIMINKSRTMPPKKKIVKKIYLFLVNVKFGTYLTNQKYSRTKMIKMSQKGVRNRL